MKEKFQEIWKIIEEGRNFALTTHLFPDGDGLGSEVALYHFLCGMGKKAKIINPQKAREIYQFFLPQNAIFIYPEERDFIVNCDAIFILDICSWERLGEMKDILKEVKAKKIYIDHHPCRSGFYDLELIDEKASSTGEIIYRFFKRSKQEISPAIASCLYIAIATDTGSFKYSNTTPATHKIAADLLDKGIDHRQIHRQLYESESMEKIRLLGRVMQELKLTPEGIVWNEVTLQTLSETGATIYDVEGIVEYLLLLGPAEVSILFVETEEGFVKASIRSKGKYKINGIAEKFNGGGHPYAAGIFRKEPPSLFIKTLLDEIRKAINGKLI